MAGAVVPAVDGQTFYNIPALSFTAVANGANPLPQVVTVASTGAQMFFSATPSTFSGGNWLTASPTGTDCCATPEAITVCVNVAFPSALSSGSHVGEVGESAGTARVSVSVAPAVL